MTHITQGTAPPQQNGQPLSVNSELLGIVRTAIAQAAVVLKGDGDPGDLAQTRKDLPNTLEVIEHALTATQPVARQYICPVKTVADLANNLLIMDQDLPIYGAQYIEHYGRRRAITVSPTVSRERVKDGRWIGEGVVLNAAVVWTRAAQPVEDQPVSFDESHIDYIRRYGGRCRDCADENGVCPSSGLPCGGEKKAITHVLDALSYGLNHGYLPALAAPATPKNAS